MTMTLVFIFICINIVVMSPTTASDDAGSILMSLVTADVEVTTDDVGICRAFRLPANQTYNIVEFMPHPLPDVYHHLNVYICENLGIKSMLPIEEVIWNCNEPNVQPGIPVATCCEKQDYPVFASFDMGTRSLKLPDGYGFPVGGDSGFNYVVLETHYPKASLVKNGRTGHSEMVIRLVPEDAGKKRSKKVGLFNLSAWALIPPRSVASISGSYIYDQSIPITPIVLLTHTHERGIDFEFWMQKKGGEDRLQWKQNPGIATYFLVPPHPLDEITDGDKLTVRCTYNNTQSNELLVVESEEMCNLLMMYAVDGKDLIPDPNIYTVAKGDADLFRQYIPSWRIVQT